MFLKKAALLIVDVQNGFINENTKHLPVKIRDLINTIDFAHIIQTRFVNRLDGPYVKKLHFKGLLDPKEIDFPKELKMINSFVINKYYYSVCTREFLDFIKLNNIDEFYIVGINTDVCVLKAAADLFELNFNCFVLQEYCASTNGLKNHDAGILVIERFIHKNNIIRDVKEFFQGRI